MWTDGYIARASDSPDPAEVTVSYAVDMRDWVPASTPPTDAPFLSRVSAEAKSQALLARPELNDTTVYASPEYREALGGLYAAMLIALQANPTTAPQQYGTDGVRTLNTVADLASRMVQRLDQVTDGFADRTVYLGLYDGNLLIDAVEAHLHHLGAGNYAVCSAPARAA